MPRRSDSIPRLTHRLGTLALLLASPLVLADASTTPVSYRYQAPITITRPGVWVALPLPASAYRHSEQDELQDLRVIDAQGQRVPFAWLPAAPAAAPADVERRRTATLYALPAWPTAAMSSAGSTHQDAPALDIRIDAGRIHIRTPVGAAMPLAAAGSAGWLIDLGARPASDSAPDWLDLQWPESADFSASFELASSDDLRHWRPAGSGLLLALHTQNTPLKQSRVSLPHDAGRYLRLSWTQPDQAPPLSGAAVLTRLEAAATPTPTTRLVFETSAPPPDQSRTSSTGQAGLYFDLGGVLPLSRIDLLLPPAIRIAPVQWQGRRRSQDPWQTLGSHVHDRQGVDGQAGSALPFSVETRVRYLRALPDERAGPLDPQQTRLSVEVRLASLLWVAQGEPPYRLQAGSGQAGPGALALNTLVADLPAQRPSFGEATLGAWQEDPSWRRAADRRQQLAALRPWLLWSVLVLGVAGLGTMVWRLWRRPPPR